MLLRMSVARVRWHALRRRVRCSTALRLSCLHELNCLAGTEKTAWESLSRAPAYQASKYSAGAPRGLSDGVEEEVAAEDDPGPSCMRLTRSKVRLSSFARAHRDLDFLRLDEQAFQRCSSESIDYAVMEHCSQAAVVPLDAQWSDIGSFDAREHIEPGIRLARVDAAQAQRGKRSVAPQRRRDPAHRSATSSKGE